MEKRGTGWIPDYPDVNDYTLKSEAIQNLDNRIQSHSDTGSIEKLAEKIFDALGVLVETKNDDDPSKTKLIEIQKSLEKKLLGDIGFVTVKLHNVFREGMADSEVLLIKNYLQRILTLWDKTLVSQSLDNSMITNTNFDSETSDKLKKVRGIQTILDDKNYVDKNDIDALKFLADFASASGVESHLCGSENILFIFANKWREVIKEDESLEQINQYPFDKFSMYQIKIAVTLSAIVEKTERIEREYQSFMRVIDISNLQQTNRVFNNFEKKLQEVIDFIEVKQKKIHEIASYWKNLDYRNKEKQAHKGHIYSSSEWMTNVSQWRKLGTKILKNGGLAQKYCDLKEEINKIKLKIEDLSDAKNISFNTTKTEIENELKALEFKTWEIYDEFVEIFKLNYKVVIPPLPPQISKKKEISIPSPIPEPITDIILNKLMSKKVLEEDKEEKKSQKIIQLIIETLVQLLMPLAQYGNLSEVVERGIEQIKYFLKGDEDEQKKTKEVIRETINEYKFSPIINFNYFKDIDFKNLIIEEVKKLKNGGEIDNLQIEYEDSILNDIIINADKQCEQSKQETQKAITKKPLFEISSSELQRLIGRVGNGSRESEDLSYQKNLVFPINSFLRQEIQNLCLDQRQPEDSSNQKSDKTEPEKLEDRKEEVTESIFLSLPEFVDLSCWCSPIEDQGSLNSCTAHAGIALMEYAEKKSLGTYTDGSSRFLYKVTRNLMQREGDSGASVRDTMKAMVGFGVCPEQYWSYDEDKFDEEPTPFCYSFAENYKTLKYFRLDYGQTSKYVLLSQVKVLLTSEIPCIFGFTLYNSVYDEINLQRGHIPLPHERDKVIGGHTVVAVGYHDRKVIENADGEPTEGALLIRNSWGTRWGQGGYGWLPYDYMLKGLTADWWSLLKAEWLATGRFGAGASAWNADKGEDRVHGG